MPLTHNYKSHTLSVPGNKFRVAGNTKRFLLVAPALVLVTLVFLVPLAHLVVFSFWKSVPGSNIPERTFSLHNFERVVSDIYYFEVYWRTFRISVVSTTTTLLMGYPLALYISRQEGARRAIKGVLMVLVLLPTVGGGLIQTLGWIVLLLPFGIVNGTLIELHLIERPLRLLGKDIGIILGLTQAFMPLMVLPLVTALSKIDVSFEQAARSLGAGRARVFREITLPLSLPGIVGGTLLVLMAHLTSFVTPLLLGQGKVQVYSTLAYQQAIEVLDYPFASAFALFPFVVAISLWLAWLLTRFLIRVVRHPPTEQVD